MEAYPLLSAKKVSEDSQDPSWEMYIGMTWA